MGEMPRIQAWIRTTIDTLAVGLVLPAAGAAQSCPPILPGGSQDPAADVRYLADDALEGRAAGTVGGRCAAAFLARRFEALGLEPAGAGGGWRQPFLLRVGAEPAGDNRFSLAGRALTLGDDWAPYGFAGSGSVTGLVVYGGAGVAQPGAPPPVAVADRVVAIEVATPDAAGLYDDPHFKATIATRRGARAVILLSGGALPELGDEARSFLRAPVVAVTGSAADAVRTAARMGAEARLEVSVRARAVEVGNVVALLVGADPRLRDEVIVIGAHFDHLGWGGADASRAQGSRTIHNGADDNASGTAALLEVARMLRAGPPLARSVLFIGFDGEELGMLGSEVYAASPARPLAGTIAMLNLDMVGRLAENGLTVFGTGTAPGWNAALDATRAALPRPLPFARVADGRGTSDHATFEARGVPVLHFFTGTHDDYHRPSDDWERVDADGVRRVAELVAELARHLANGVPLTER